MSCICFFNLYFMVIVIKIVFVGHSAPSISIFFLAPSFISKHIEKMHAVTYFLVYFGVCAHAEQILTRPRGSCPFGQHLI